MDMGCLVAGVRINTGVRLSRPDTSASRAAADYLEGVLGLSDRLWHELPGPQGSTSLVLRAEAREALMPGHDSLNLRQALDPVVHDLDHTLEREIAVALLGGPQVFTFESLGAFASHVRVQRRICRAAARTAVAFKPLAAERPDQYWTYDEEAGFLLQPGQSLSDALRAATQPSVTGQLYDFSCYRASEYVILLGLSEELEQVNPAQLAQLEARCRRRAIRSREFHDVFLDEFGSHDSPVPARYFVPGDRLWFRNPDERSSDALGYEGSWVIYLGGGLFSNFWKHEQPYTLEDKCIEIFHWRDGAYQDEHQEWQMDEARVEACVAATQADAAARTRVLQRMMRLRDPQGVYAEGGCLDASREQPKSVWPQRSALHVLPA
ncbi:MAG: hypothetical protein ACKOJ7_03560 [Betaproteobacteria bacterium]